MSVDRARRVDARRAGARAGGRRPGAPTGGPTGLAGSAGRRATTGPTGSTGAVGLWRRMLAQVAGAAAVLAGAGGLEDLVLDGAWWRPVLVPVSVVLLIGLLGSLARVWWWLTALAQLVALPLAVSGATGSAPTELIGQALDTFPTISVAVPPVAATPSLLVLLGLAFGLVGIAVDACVRTLPALAGAPILAVVVTTMTIAESALPRSAILAPAAAYLLVLLLTVPLPRAAGGATAARAGATTLLAGVVVGAAALGAGGLAPRVAPDVSTGGLLTRPEVSTGRIGSAPMTGLTGELLRDEPVPILELTPGEGPETWQPDYLRGAVLTEYVPGAGWEGGTLGSTDPSDAGYTSVVYVDSVGYAGWYLPVPDGTVRLLDPAGVWAYDADLEVWHTERARDPGHYLLGVDQSRPTTDELAGDTVNPSSEETAIAALPSGVAELAQELVAGAETPFARAQALQQFFLDRENGFTYSLTVPDGSTGDPLLDFLEVRTGYCEQYASTMAVLARAVGLPARVVVGYGPGSTSGGITTITTHDAHAWVEIRFEEAGWVRFDPTPPDGSHRRIQGYTVPAVEPEPTSGATSTAAPAPSSSPVKVEIDDPQPSPSASSGAAPGASTGSADRWWWLVAGALVGGSVVGVGPSAERARRRRRRLARVRDADAGAAWEEVEALAVDHGVPLAEGASLRRGAHDLSQAVRLDERVRSSLTVLVRGAERSWYADGVDPSATVGRGGARSAARESAERQVAAVGAVHAALASSHPRRGRARWFPRSLLPRSFGARRREPGRAGQADADD
ncbi:transglutaminase-like putative cysteine protease [Salana multivorans]|uniref:Transglutaminase-like putative cysteine protease n=1 Tax=Salana multivorans TaxID=120377 RepID=A0A3N2D9P1_9MICO|nr:transglutaminase domain-containing protein [Salana multivorans]ROR96515.1 transglutaminase-like putative cysteine protease [Salana multivorans]